MSWINPTLELPNVNTKVLIAISPAKNDDGYTTTIGALFCERKIKHWHAVGFPIGIHQQVVAWMPLPEYKEGEED